MIKIIQTFIMATIFAPFLYNFREASWGLAQAISTLGVEGVVAMSFILSVLFLFLSSVSRPPDSHGYQDTSCFTPGECVRQCCCVVKRLFRRQQKKRPHRRHSEII